VQLAKASRLCVLLDATILAGDNRVAQPLFFDRCDEFSGKVSGGGAQPNARNGLSSAELSPGNVSRKQSRPNCWPHLPNLLSCQSLQIMIILHKTLSYGKEPVVNKLLCAPFGAKVIENKEKKGKICRKPNPAFPTSASRQYSRHNRCAQAYHVDPDPAQSNPLCH